MYQYGLTRSKPNGGLKKIGRGAVRTAALGLIDITITRHVFMQELASTRTRDVTRIGFDFAVTLSSPDSSCVLFEITSEQSVELKWLMLNKHKR